MYPPVHPLLHLALATGILLTQEMLSVLAPRPPIQGHPVPCSRWFQQTPNNNQPLPHHCRSRWPGEDNSVLEEEGRAQYGIPGAWPIPGHTSPTSSKLPGG